MTETPKRRPKKQDSSRRLLPPRRRARELLADGEWHDAEKLIVEVMKVVTPGVAYRRAEQMRRAQQLQDGGVATDRKRDPGTDVVVRIGQRAIARDVLAGREFEVQPRLSEEPSEGERRRVRLLKDQLGYPGWRTPEDMTEHTRKVLGLWMSGLSAPEIHELLGVKRGAYSVLEVAKKHFDLPSLAPHVVIPALVERGLLTMPEQDDLEKRLLEDYRSYSSNQPDLQARRLKVSRQDLERARRRLMLRHGYQYPNDLFRAVRAGKV